MYGINVNMCLELTGHRVAKGVMNVVIKMGKLGPLATLAQEMNSLLLV